MESVGSNSNDSRIFGLKWTNHTDSIIQTFVEQRRKGWLVDVTLSCEGQFIKAHRMLLSACSPYFVEIFKVHQVDHPLIIFNDVKYTMLQYIINFMYEGEIQVAEDDLQELLVTAEKLNIKGLCNVRQGQSTQLKKEKPEVETPSPLVSQQMDTSPADVNVNAETEMNVNINQEKSRKRRKQSHSAIVNQSVEGTAAESLFLTNNLRKQFSTEQLNTEQEEPTKDRSIRVAPKVPRPANAFMIFANEYRKKLAEEYSGDSNKEISIRLGSLWKGLPVVIKNIYYAAAKKADEEHKIKYPGYYYSPKEARLRKEMRINSSAKTSSVSTSNAGAIADIDTSSIVTLVIDDELNDNEELIPHHKTNERLENNSNGIQTKTIIQNYSPNQ